MLLTDKADTCAQSQMKATYGWCAEQAGPGLFLRMKTHMESDVDGQRRAMFDASSRLLMDQLWALQVE